MELKRTTVRDLRRHNRSALLSKLFFDGPLSRHELSSLTGLSAATVSNVTGELIEERLIVEAGLIDSDGGRPRVLLRVDPHYGHVVGIDVGETGVKVELFDLSMTALATVEHQLPSVRPGVEVEVLSWVLLLSGPAPANDGEAPPEPPRYTPQPARRRPVFDSDNADFIEVAIYERAALVPGAVIAGPAVIVEDETSTVVSRAFDARIDAYGYIELTRRDRASQ